MFTLFFFSVPHVTVMYMLFCVPVRCVTFSHGVWSDHYNTFPSITIYISPLIKFPISELIVSLLSSCNSFLDSNNLTPQFLRAGVTKCFGCYCCKHYNATITLCQWNYYCCLSSRRVFLSTREWRRATPALQIPASIFASTTMPGLTQQYFTSNSENALKIVKILKKTSKVSPNLHSSKTLCMSSWETSQWKVAIYISTSSIHI